jgi:hypothetical protein
MDWEKLEFYGVLLAILCVLLVIGIFVRMPLRRRLKAALGASYREERTYAGVGDAIALDEHGLRFAWFGIGIEGTVVIGVHEVVEVICEKNDKAFIPYTELRILTSRDDLKGDLYLQSYFRQDRLKEIAARLNAMRDKAKVSGIAAPIPQAATAAETDSLIIAIQQLTIAVTKLTGSMRRFSPADGRRRPIRKNRRK